MTTKDIGLVVCPVWSVETPQLGVPLLQAYMKSLGYGSFSLDLTIRIFSRSEGIYRQALASCDTTLLSNPQFVSAMFEEYKDVIDESMDLLLDSGARVFGFPVYFTNLVASMEFARRLKQKDSSRVIVFGGPEVKSLANGGWSSSWRSKQVLYHTVDAFVTGEGETVFHEVMQRLKGGRPRSTPGAYVKSEGEYSWCGEGKAIADRNGKPPAADDLDLDFRGAGRLEKNDLVGVLLGQEKVGA